jgi:hypothetical protein
MMKVRFLGPGSDLPVVTLHNLIIEDDSRALYYIVHRCNTIRVVAVLFYVQAVHYLPLP